jgi:hypothetical protein
MARLHQQMTVGWRYIHDAVRDCFFVVSKFRDERAGRIERVYKMALGARRHVTHDKNRGLQVAGQLTQYGHDVLDAPGRSTNYDDVSVRTLVRSGLG